MTVSRYGLTITFDQGSLFDHLSLSGLQSISLAYPAPIDWDRALYDLEMAGLEEWQLELIEDELGVV